MAVRFYGLPLTIDGSNALIQLLLIVTISGFDGMIKNGLPLGFHEYSWLELNYLWQSLSVMEFGIEMSSDCWITILLTMCVSSSGFHWLIESMAYAVMMVLCNRATFGFSLKQKKDEGCCRACYSIAACISITSVSVLEHEKLRIW